MRNLNPTGSPPLWGSQGFTGSDHADNISVPHKPEEAEFFFCAVREIPEKHAGGALVGSINFSILFSHLFKRTDVREYGSGNPGTTNMFRVFGLRMGALTFLCDALKGVVACLVSAFIFDKVGFEPAAVTTAKHVAGLFAVLGHVFPVYYGFKGGKGVATSIGVMFCLEPLVTLCCMLPIIALILITDRMSVMSICYAVFNIVWAWAVSLGEIGAFNACLVTVMFAVVLFAHRHNIVRLVKGHELPTGVRRALKGKASVLYEKPDKTAVETANEEEQTAKNQSSDESENSTKK